MQSPAIIHELNTLLDEWDEYGEKENAERKAYEAACRDGCTPESREGLAKYLEERKLRLRAKLEQETIIELSGGRMPKKELAAAVRETEEFQARYAKALAGDSRWLRLNSAVCVADLNEKDAAEFLRLQMKTFRSSFETAKTALRVRAEGLGDDLLVACEQEEAFRPLAEGFRSHLETKLDRYFLSLDIDWLPEGNEEFYHYRKRFRRKNYRMLTAENLPEFIQSFLSERDGFLPEQKAMEILGYSRYDPVSNCLIDYAGEQGFALLKTAERLAGEMRYWSLKQKLIDLLAENAALNAVFQETLREYDRTNVVKLLRCNANYERIFSAYDSKIEADERLRRGLLDAIPETYPELFPLARQLHRHFILHVGPTNSGKSYSSLEALREVSCGIYLAPLRLLAYEKYEELNEAGVPCTLKTGEEKIYVEGARVQSSTIEILDFSREYDLAVIDEVQMLADAQRGSAWTMALLGIRCPLVHLCLAPEAEQIVTEIIRACEDSFEIVRHERLVPLTYSKPAREVFPRRAQRGDAFIVFSRRDVHACAAALQDAGCRCSMIYGNLPYDVRRNEVKRYINGETDVVVATDAIGMGLNLPIRRVIFLKTVKFDGEDMRPLLPGEIRQIAGRAGRFGMFEEGFALSDTEECLVKEALESLPEELTGAVIGFPTSMVGIPGKLSELMRKWCDIEPKPGFASANLTVQIQLSEELERLSEDKELIFRFVMTPFDEKNTRIKDLWKKLFKIELHRERFRLRDYLPEADRNNELAQLEEDFKICDLLYHYADTSNYPDYLQPILQRKAEISGIIMQKLAKAKLESKKCRSCGAALPWNFAFSVCDKCHNRGRKISRPVAETKKRG